MSVISGTSFANTISDIDPQEEQSKSSHSFSLGSYEVKKLFFNTPEAILLNPFRGGTTSLRLFPEFPVSSNLFLLMEGVEREKAPLSIAGTLTFQVNHWQKRLRQEDCGMWSCPSLEDGFLVTDRAVPVSLKRKGKHFIL